MGFVYVWASVPLPIVVVEVAPADADRELVQVLIDACSSAVPRGSCVRAGPDGTETAAPEGVAIVSWEQQDRVRVEVGVKKQARGEWLSQELSFKAEDEPAERWRAAGLSIGTLVGEMRWQGPRPKREGVANPTPDPPRRDLGAPKAPRPEAASRAWLDAGPVFGPALDDASWRLGAFARGAFQPASVPAFGSLSISHQTRPDDARDVGVAWTAAGLGAGYRSSDGGSALGAALRIEAVWQYVRVSARDPQSGVSGSAASSLFGLRVGGDASWTLARPLALFLGAELLALNTPVDVRLRDEHIGSAPRIQYSLLGGARFWLR